VAGIAQVCVAMAWTIATAGKCCYLNMRGTVTDVSVLAVTTAFNTVVLAVCIRVSSCSSWDRVAIVAKDRYDCSKQTFMFASYESNNSGSSQGTYK